MPPKDNLETYSGLDRVVHAEEKRLEVEEKKKLRPPFRATLGSGFSSFDGCIEGFRKGQLVVLSGPPKHGKTQMAVSFTERLWDRFKVLWIEYELNEEEFLDRFPENAEGKLDFYLPNYVESGNLKWVEDKIIEAKRKFKTEIIFIDNLDFLRDPEIMRNVSVNLASYVGGIVQKVKMMAMKHELVIFLLTHIRKNEWTSNELPRSQELRDTGMTAQLADIVLMMMRKAAPKISEEVYDENKAYLGVMENRHNGRTKKIKMVLDGKKFVEGFWEDDKKGTKKEKAFLENYG